MDFHADDNLPVTGRTLDQFLSIGTIVHDPRVYLKVRRNVSSIFGSDSSDARQV
jgi:hypothetical protein